MSLVFSAIVPHPPILIPTVGKEHTQKIAATQAALERLEQDLYATKPEIVIIISPHGDVQADAFTINLSNQFNGDLKQFGDFSTTFTFKGDTVLFTLDKERINDKSPTTIVSTTTVDHGVSIPLSFLLRHLPEVRIVPINFSLLDNQSHYEFGKSLKEVSMNSDKRIAIIASADLSHCLTEQAPLPFNPAGKEFDDRLIALLRERDIQSLINLDSQLIERAGECGLRSILIMLGALHNMNFQTQIISYEAPFGVGYLTARFTFE